MGYATSPISSRFLDAVLTQAAVPSKYKRMLMNGFMGRYKFLVEDRMGSRVGDTIWDHADGFMKVCSSPAPLP
jgi:nucleolar protein 9